jgi:hypothetical protein
MYFLWEIDLRSSFFPPSTLINKPVLTLKSMSILFPGPLHGSKLAKPETSVTGHIAFITYLAWFFLTTTCGVSSLRPDDF